MRGECGCERLVCAAETVDRIGLGGVPRRFPPGLCQLASAPPKREEDEREGQDSGELQYPLGEPIPPGGRDEVEEGGQDVGQSSNREVHPSPVREPGENVPSQDEPPDEEHQGPGPAQAQDAYQPQGMHLMGDARGEAQGFPLGPGDDSCCSKLR